jgi:hypothetical protein
MHNIVGVKIAGSKYRNQTQFRLIDRGKSIIRECNFIAEKECGRQ